MGKNTTLLKIRIQYFRLAILVCLMAFGLTGFSQSGRTNLSHPETGTVRLQNSPLSIEDISLRDEFSRTFRNPDGSFTKQQTKNPVHYKDESGRWMSIQQIPERNKKNAALIEIRRTNLPISINTQNGISQMFLQEDKMISFGGNAKILWVNDDNSFSKTTNQAAVSKHDFSSNEVVLKNIFPGIDRKQELDYNQLRTDYVINQSLNLPVSVKCVVFEDHVSLPAGWKINYASGEMTSSGWKGELEITNEKNEFAGRFSLPVFYDAFQSQSKSALSAHITKGTYKISKSGDGYDIQILVPAQWLNSPDRVYPVTIDPTVTGSKVPPGSVYGFAYSGGCQETLTINVPGGTITGTASAYNITARNGGWRSEQRSRIGCGPNWTADQTNGNGSGGSQAYNLTGLNIANGIWCGGDVTFTWQGYRTYDSYADNSCDTYNQYRSGNWDVTVTYTAGAASAPANVGWSVASGGNPSSPTSCGGWSGTWCATSGTYTDLSLIQGINYTVENTAAASCGTALASAYLQSWWSGGSTSCGYGAIGSPGVNTISFNAEITGNHRIGVTANVCGIANTCGLGLNNNYIGGTAVLRYKQNTTVNNTTSTADICLTGTKTLTATVGGAHNNPAIAWYVMSGGGSISGNTYTPTSAGNKTVRAVVGDCYSDITFNVIDPGSTPLTISGTTSICNGESTILTASGGSAYSWSPATGLSATTGSSVTASPGSTQAYVVTETTGACVSDGNVTVTVTPGITPVFNPVADICAGDALAALPATSNNGITGTWSPALDNTATTTYTFTPNAGQCGIPTTLTITVNTLPVAAIMTSTTGICPGETAVLTASGGTTYTWTPATGLSATTGSVVNASPAATQTYTVTATMGSCSDTEIIMINVTPLAVAVVSNVPSVCAGESATMTASGAVTYTWTPATGLNATTGDEVIATPTATQTYTVTGTDGLCQGSQNITITVKTNPTVSVTPAIANLCAGSSITLTGVGASSYVWLPTLSSGPTVTVSPMNTTTYTALGTAANGCVGQGTTTVTVTSPPSATISYSGLPYCTSITIPQAVIRTGTSGGTYTSTAGLAINASTGAITPSASTAGTYTVTYSIAASGGCALYTTTTSVTINAVPVATITYPGSPFCGNVSVSQSVSHTGSSGGVYTSTAGLTIDSGTGAIIPSTSTAGTYTVTYSIAAASGCPAVTATATVTITTPPSATISYTGSPFCTSLTAPQSVVHTGTTGGTYTSTTGLTINASTGAITPSTSTAGMYTVTYTIAPGGGCPVYTTTTTVEVNANPTATISYPGTPFCDNLSLAQNVSQTGTTGGTYTSTAGLTINPTTGAITPSLSTAGTYTVTYTIAAASGCPAVTATTSVTINVSPAATISYGSPFCKSLTTPQTVTLTGTTGGTYSSTAGLTINASTGAITPSTSTNGTYTVTYTIAAAGGCPVYTATTTITINPVPTATVSYPGTPFCGNLSIAQNVSQTGTTGGTYTSTAGLTMDASTGAITPSTSTAGTYTVTYTIAASGGCAAVTATTSVTINAAPSSTISYGSPFCTSITAPQAVTLTGTTGGTYSSTPGLTINTSTGAITPSTSTAGTYTVTYTIAAAGGCPVYTTTASVNINALPVATISYSGTPFCGSLSSAQNVSQTGTAGGTYTSTAGLTINASTGAIIPSTSTAGTYTVTYTIAASGGCAAVTATTSVTITTPPTATISYSSPFCTSVTAPQSVTQTGTTGGVYSSTAGLTIGAVNGAITPSSSVQGTYTVTYTIAASNGCPVVTATTSVTVNPLPTATISYSGSPFCGNLGSQNVTQTGTTGGTYTSSAGLTINASTGSITPSTSTAGTYTVTYTITAGSGCPAVIATTSVTITVPPSATISYSGSPFCTSLSGAQAVIQTGTTGGTYTSTAGLTINASTGVITPSTSTAGTYAITYTMAAANGCPAMTASTSVTITTAPTGTISYTGSPYCASVSSPQPVSFTGTTGGTYSSTVGLSMDATTGAVLPNLSTPGTYTITYTVAATGGCAAFSTTTLVTINAVPVASIAYSATQFCSSISAAQAVILTGTSGGTYSSTSGLSLNAFTGAITPSSSTPGIYTVTYEVTPGGCSMVSTNTTVEIVLSPTANITYSGPYCASVPTPQTVTLNGTGNYTGGTYAASPSGLSINPTTGAIIPNLSTAGTYLVIYTVPATSGCSSGTATVNVNIIGTPSAIISYASPFCSNMAGNQPVTFSGVSGGTFSSTTGLTINTATGAITPSTSTPGMYVVTYNTPASGSCPPGTATATVEILATPVISDLADQALCDLTYTLPAITGTFLTGNEMYYTATNGGGAAYPVGTVLTSTTQLYIYDANGSCADEEMFTITINQTPVITNPGDQAVCGTYALPIISGTNLSGSQAYYNNSQALGGTVISGSITSSQTVWIYDANGTCTSEESFNVTINSIPDASFTASDYCGGTGAAPVITGVSGGTFSFNPAVTDGATINASTGLISNGVAGTIYTIEYTVSGLCPVSTQDQVTFIAVPANPSTGNGATYCSSETFVGMTANASAGGTLTWYNDAALTNQVGTGTSVIPANVNGTTTYYVTETVSGCQGLPSTVVVTVKPSPIAPDAGNNITYCKGDSISALNATGIIGNTFIWYNDAALTNVYGTGNSVIPANTLGSKTYYLTQTANGCESTSASVTVTIEDCFELKIPSAFTPGDGDNVNNTWEIPELNARYPNNKVTIFNRWGQILYNSDGYTTPWDGQYNGENLPVGSYYYIIELHDAANTPNRTGTVTIIRN